MESMSFLHLVATAPGGGAAAVMSLMPMLMIFGIFYIVWFMPIRKKQKQLQALIDGLSKGDRVVTTGGLYGEVAKTEGSIVLLKLGDNVKVRVAKSAIAGLQGNPNDS